MFTVGTSWMVVHVCSGTVLRRPNSAFVVWPSAYNSSLGCNNSSGRLSVRVHSQSPRIVDTACLLRGDVFCYVCGMCM